MSSKKDSRDAIFAQRADAASAAKKNQTHVASPHGIRQNGSNHSKVTRQGNPGRTNRTAPPGK